MSTSADQRRAPGVFPKDRIPAITDAQWVKIAIVFSAPTGCTPEDLSARAGVPEDVAGALLLGMGAHGLVDLFWQIYHGCSDAPVARRPLDEGFPPLPWTCPGCGREASGKADLLFDLFGESRGPIVFASRSI